MMKPSGHVTLIAAVAICAAPSFVWPQDEGSGEPLRSRQPSRLTADRYSVTLGVYALHARTTVRLDSPDGTVGTTINFENDLGIGRRELSRDVTFTARFRGRHRLEIEEFGLARQGSRSNSRTLRFGEDTFDVGWELATFFDTDLLRVGYAYSLIGDDNRELGLHIGVHVTDIAMGIRASVTPGASQAEEYADATAPLPVIGLQGAYQMTRRWSLHGRAQIFRLDADDFDGVLNHVALAIEHDTFRHVGLGIAADFFELDLNSKDTGLLGAFKFQFSGPRIFFHAHF
jgi:hypothetical protein